MENRLQAVKSLIREYINGGNCTCGLFFTRNLVNDTMETIYEKDGIIVDVCYFWDYFEIFGLTEDEQAELTRYYDLLVYAERCR